MSRQGLPILWNIFCEGMGIVMNKKMFKLAVNTLWCDIKHSFRGYNLILLLLLFAISIVPINDSIVLCFASLIQVAIMKVMPSCERILFIMPLDAGDRKKFMIYRQFTMEAVFVLLILVTSWIKMLTFGQGCSFAKCVVNNPFVVAVMMFETTGSIYFCGWYKDVSKNEKGFGIFFSILAWVAFATAFMFSTDEEFGRNALMLILGCVGVSVQALVKLYYMVHSAFEEYKLVDVNQGLNGGNRKKTNAADEVF